MSQKLPRGLIVSCQAQRGEVFYGLGIMRHMALAAQRGGAVAIRALFDEIPEIKKAVDLPIIGLIKKVCDCSDVYITPTTEEIDLLLGCGCEVIAVDATRRYRDGGITLEELVRYVRQKSKVELMADISTFEEAADAEKLGFDYISTTLRGYTQSTERIRIPDLKFVKKLLKHLRTPVVVEGGIWESAQIKKISALNPYAVVVGTAITRPQNITERFNGLLHLTATKEKIKQTAALGSDERTVNAAKNL